jgi:hypothetical protein
MTAATVTPRDVRVRETDLEREVRALANRYDEVTGRVREGGIGEGQYLMAYFLENAPDGESPLRHSYRRLAALTAREARRVWGDWS